MSDKKVNVVTKGFAKAWAYRPKTKMVQRERKRLKCCANKGSRRLDKMTIITERHVI